MTIDPMKKGATGSAHCQINCSPSELFDLVSEISNIPRWSPECTAATWLGGASGPAVGAKFRGWNRRRALRWFTVSRVSALRPDEEFSFITMVPVWGDFVEWTYEIAPGDAPDSCTLTQRFTMQRDLPLPLKKLEEYGMGVKDRHSDLTENLEACVQRIKVLAEAKIEGTTV